MTCVCEKNFEDLSETKKTDQSIREAESEFVENGLLFDAGETLDLLRRNHFG